MKTRFAFASLLAWALTVLLSVSTLVACSVRGPERSVVATGTFLGDSRTLSTLAGKIRASRLVGPEYELIFTKDLGYEGEYVVLSYKGDVILFALKLPDGPPEYAVKLHDTSGLPPGHGRELSGILDDVFGVDAFNSPELNSNLR